MPGIERFSQTDALVSELKRFFLSDKLEIGDKLPTEKQLCETYHVGRSTVREAIRTLQVLGFVELRPGRGAFLLAKKVSSLEAALLSWYSERRPSLDETLRIRSQLSILAVGFAIEKGLDTDLARIDLARLSFENALIRRGSEEELCVLEDTFHRMIVEAAHSELLLVIDPVVNAAYGGWRGRAVSILEYASRLVVPYQHITLAILARDRELAELQTRRHFEQMATYMTTNFA